MSAPFTSPPLAVRAEWTDYNGHLNMAYYHVLFDSGLDMMLASLGLGAQTARDSGSSVFTAQAQVHYLRELHAGDAVIVRSRLIACDAKRLHYVQTMDHASGGWTAAVTENLLLHVDLRIRRVAPWPEATAARLAQAVADHAGLPMPPQVGRRVGLARS